MLLQSMVIFFLAFQASATSKTISVYNSTSKTNWSWISHLPSHAAKKCKCKILNSAYFHCLNHSQCSTAEHISIYKSLFWDNKVFKINWIWWNKLSHVSVQDLCKPGNSTIFLLLKQIRAISGLDKITPLVLFWSALPSHSTLPGHNLCYNIHSMKGEQVKLAAKASCYCWVLCWESPASSSVLACKQGSFPLISASHSKTIEKVNLCNTGVWQFTSNAQLPFKLKQ